MARKLPWAGNLGPASKRPHQQDRVSPQDQNSADGRGRRRVRQMQITTPPTTPRKRRFGSRTPSTSPPPGPPAVEPMREGYDEDDIWMMVEDEFQSLAQTFTAHLHHAEYKRLMKKAREAPPKELPDPQSPMSKKTKRRLQRRVLDERQQSALHNVGARSCNDSIDADEDKVDDPWRGTALAGLIALGSQEKTSLKGLEKMPSSTRAAQGFSKAEIAQSRKVDAIDLLTRRSEKRNILTSKKKRPATRDSDEQDEDQDKVYRDSAKISPANEKLKDIRLQADSEKTSADRPVKNPESSSSNFQDKTMPAMSRQPTKSWFLLKRKKVKEENKEDRLAEVPMFLN